MTDVNKTFLPFGVQVYVIGCGGIGGFLLNLLPQTLTCLALDKEYQRHMQSGLDESILDKLMNAILSSEGMLDRVPDTLDSEQQRFLFRTIVQNIENRFEKLVLIDGDSFSGHNALRQTAIAGSKMEIQMSNIRKQDAFTTWLHTCKLEGYNTYLNPSNMYNIFDISKRKKNTYKNDTYKVIFLCVDNHKTRYEVTRFAEEHLNNCLIINGGNNKTTGNVTVYEKLYGTPLDPPIYKIYPEVTATADKRPDEVGCGQVALHNDQTAITNNIIASLMLDIFRIRYMEGTLERKTRKLDPKTKKNITTRTNEIILDLDALIMSPLSRSKDLDNRPKSIVTEELDEDQIM